MVFGVTLRVCVGGGRGGRVYGDGGGCDKELRDSGTSSKRSRLPHSTCRLANTKRFARIWGCEMGNFVTKWVGVSATTLACTCVLVCVCVYVCVRVGNCSLFGMFVYRVRLVLLQPCEQSAHAASIIYNNETKLNANEQLATGFLSVWHCL